MTYIVTNIIHKAYDDDYYLYINIGIHSNIGFTKPFAIIWPSNAYV